MLHKNGFKIIEKIIDKIKHEEINNIYFLKFSLTIKVWRIVDDKINIGEIIPKILIPEITKALNIEK